MSNQAETPVAIAFVGFGEAASAFAEGWRGAGIAVSATAYDIKTDSASAAIRDAKRADYAAAGIAGAATLADALAARPLVFSLVTADQAHAAASNAAQGDLAGALFLDCNSCAPGTKRRSAQLVENAGGRYVDVAVMAPVHPRLHRTPLLVSGLHAQAAADALQGLGMAAGIVAGELGAASAIKMTRSIMIKGLEALVAECVLAGRKAGIEDAAQMRLVDQRPGQPDALVEAGEMRRGVDMRPQPRAFEARADHRDGRSLAVGARDMDHWRDAPLWVAERVEDAPHPVQRQVDDLRVERHHPVEERV